MPNSVQVANPTAVFPKALATAFTASRDWTVDTNQYANGEYQRDVPEWFDPADNSTHGFASSRKSWQLTERLTADDWATLLAFWQEVDGCQTEFWFYDPYETSPYFFYDPTGASPTGRFAVRFNGALTYAIGMGRPVQVGISLLEVA